MKKLMRNEKGFTLIELLAVIVILGILMIVAIPMVTRYIEQARRDTFVDTAKAYINAARYAYLNDDYSMEKDANCSQSTDAQIPIDRIDVDNAGKSSFGGDLAGYVAIETCSTSDSTKGTIYKYKYRIYLVDVDKGWGINGEYESDLSRNKVTKENFSAAKSAIDAIGTTTIKCPTINRTCEAKTK